MSDAETPENMATGIASDLVHKVAGKAKEAVGKHTGRSDLGNDAPGCNEISDEKLAEAHDDAEVEQRDRQDSGFPT